MKKFKKIIKHQIKKTAESVNLSAVVLRLVINYIVIYNFFGSAADVVHLSTPILNKNRKVFNPAAVILK
ncbi:MAG: hypothetical protein J6B80_07570 [Clostridia bacterium]|nr:hypothetical protein [Clostridia bacterium]